MIKRLAPGITRRKDGRIVVVAQQWGCPGKRVRTLPPETNRQQAIEYRQTLLKELHSEHNPSTRSLKFGAYIEHYKSVSGDHAKSSTVKDIAENLGHLLIPEVEAAFERFIDMQRTRGRRVWKNEGGTLKLVETEQLLSEAAIKAYKRYYKAICRAATMAPSNIRLSKDLDPSAAVVVGKSEKRRRPILQIERDKIIAAISESSPWMLPVLQFARTMPIRPGDQLSLKWSQIDEIHNQIPYLPAKTAKTELLAYPAILPELREYILGRVGDAECNAVFFKEESGKRIPINFWCLSSAFDRACVKAGVNNVRWYDWRHDAVNYLLSIGFSKGDVMRFAGWSSGDMVDWYDTADQVRFSQRCNAILQNASIQFKETRFA